MITSTIAKPKKTTAPRKSKGTPLAPGAFRLAAKSGPSLMEWRRERGISRELFAEMADFSVRKLATYEKSPTLPNRIVRPVTETMRLISALRELAGDDAALKDWLRKPNPAFGRKTPLALIKTGEADLLWEMIHQLRQGEFA